MENSQKSEMLTVSRAKLLDAFNSAKIIASSKMSSKMLAGAAEMCINTFKDLFGSKCLPDEEPKVKKYLVGEYVRVSDDARLPKEFRGHVGKVVFIPTDVQRTVDVGGGVVPQVFHIDHLRPVIREAKKPTESAGTHQQQYVPLSPKSGTYSFDRIVERGFCDHNRLHIAAMAMQGILSNSHQEMVDMKIDKVAELAFEVADALIKASEKGGSHE